MALQSDGWHVENLMQQLSNKDSALHKFACGNKSTLYKEGMRENLLQFHEKWYSSNIMTLTVYGKQDLDTLEGWVKDKFSPIVNKNVERPDLGQPEAFGPDNLGKFVKYIPITDDDQLLMFWILPYLENEIKS